MSNISNNSESYNGWKITKFTHQRRDHFCASRHGVTMNTNTLEGVKSMVDRKNHEMSNPIINNQPK